MKGLLDVSKYKLTLFVVIRMLLAFLEPLKAWLIAEMMGWIANGQVETLE